MTDKPTPDETVTLEGWYTEEADRCKARYEGRTSRCERLLGHARHHEVHTANGTFMWPLSLDERYALLEAKCASLESKAAAYDAILAYRTAAQQAEGLSMALEEIKKDTANHGLTANVITRRVHLRATAALAASAGKEGGN